MYIHRWVEGRHSAFSSQPGEEGQAVWEYLFFPSSCLGLTRFTGLKVCMLRLLNLGSQASGSSKAPVEHWEMFCLLLSLEVGTSFCSEAEALPCPALFPSLHPKSPIGNTLINPVIQNGG